MNLLPSLTLMKQINFSQKTYVVVARDHFCMFIGDICIWAHMRNLKDYKNFSHYYASLYERQYCGNWKFPKGACSSHRCLEGNLETNSLCDFPPIKIFEASCVEKAWTIMKGLLVLSKL